MTAFPHLFSPIQIGSVTVKNRILSSGHDTVMAEDGRIGDRLVAYHEARAKGGAGLIVAQVAGVHQSAKYSASILMADTDDCIAGYRALAETVHPHGTVLFGQLFHDGREMMESQDGSLLRSARAFGGADRTLPRDASRDAGRADRGDRRLLRFCRTSAADRRT